MDAGTGIGGACLLVPCNVRWLGILYKQKVSVWQSQVENEH